MTLSLERRAALWGDRTAVVDQSADRRVGYADLESEADGMARRLSALGVGPGDPVAVVSRNRVETLALLFAVRRLGGVFAPVSHRLTPATVERPLEAIDPVAVVHEPAQRDLVRELPDDLTHAFEDLGRHETADYERADRDPGDSLLYLHTEDGERVVDLPERTVEWNCVTAAAAWGLGRGDCAPALLPFSDTDGLHRLALPLLYVGGRVVVLRAFAPDDALAAVEAEGATALFAGPTEYRQLVGSDRFDATDFGSVEWVGTRGPLPADAREVLARKAPVVRGYGRVETGPNNLYRPPGSASSGSPDADTGAGPDSPVADCAGRPFPDCEVRVVTEQGESAAAGEVGELQFRGPVTPRGYLDGEGGVDEFPAWVSAGDLAYREGDDYYLLGRDGDATGGESVHVDPRTVERSLEAREGVTAAGVVPAAEGVLAAFVGDADPGELRTDLGDELPEGAAVRKLDRVESLPRRSTGELDRAALRRDLSGEERFDED